MDKLFTIELTLKEWIEIMIAVNELGYSKKIYENNEKKANEEKEIVEKIQKQITQTYDSITKK